VKPEKVRLIGYSTWMFRKSFKNYFGKPERKCHRPVGGWLPNEYKVNSFYANSNHLITGTGLSNMIKKLLLSSECIVS
jgi:hypothetical protein